MISISCFSSPNFLQKEAAECSLTEGGGALSPMCESENDLLSLINLVLLWLLRVANFKEECAFNSLSSAKSALSASVKSDCGPMQQK